MTNILGDDKRQQVLTLGQLGWTLRRIGQATGMRRETASAYLKAAGITVCGPRQRQLATPNPASEVSTDPGALRPGITDPLSGPPPPGRAPAASACAPYRHLIELALNRGRNAMGAFGVNPIGTPCITLPRIQIGSIRLP